LGFLVSKKGDALNRLKSLIPKRQIPTVNRQKRAVFRQKGLALLSFMCQCPDCSVTKLDGENDGSATDCGTVHGREPNQHQTGLSRVPNESERTSEK
jgi:hypothetical protein